MRDQVVNASWRMLGFTWVLKVGRADIPGEVREGLSQRGKRSSKGMEAGMYRVCSESPN